MSTLNKQDIDKLLEMLNAFHRYPTWTSAKRESWNQVLQFVKHFEYVEFSGDHQTYGISLIGEVKIHQPNSPSTLYRKNFRTNCLIICVGHGQRKSRTYFGFDFC
mgnify:CR=1 FL=1